MKAPYISPIQNQEFPVAGSIKDQILFCCQYAALAPSVHNLQPWAIRLIKNKLVVSVYKSQATKDSDATGRQTWISIGCFVENLVQAAFACGMKTSIVKQDYTNDEIVIEFGPSKHQVNQSILANMEARVSNRNKFSPITLAPKQRKLLEATSQGLSGAKLFIGSDKKTIEKVAMLTRQAIALALSMPRFKKELGQTFRNNMSKRKTGIPGHALGRGLIGSFIEPLRYQYLTVAPKESEKEFERVKASAGIMFITTTGDVAKYWLQAGRLYERVALLLAEFGISQATIAATVEAPDFHQEIEKHIGTKNRLQAVIRYGKSSKYIAPSPRLSVEDIFTSNASRD